ncbi:MAG: T9SS type A sorting domain-containing protein [Saprospiraceae bacterium]|nr:T9SS type A sorting domain-containing protein [Saprospiraceae bacterium]
MTSRKRLALFPYPIAILIGLLFFGHSLSAQTFSQKLIEPSTLLPDNLGFAESARFQQISQYPFTDTTVLITLRDLLQSSEDGLVQVQFPLCTCGDVIFKTVFAEYENANNYRWEGVVETTDTVGCIDGYLTLVARNGRRFGHLALDGEFYEIQEVASGKHAFSKISFQGFSGNECGVFSNDTSNLITAENRTEEQCEVRVLVLYNQSTIDLEGSVEAVEDRAFMSLFQTRTALSNSMVSENDVRIVLAGVEQIPNHVQTEPIAEDEIDNLKLLQFVTEMRDDRGADLVVFLTGDDYDGRSGNGEIDILGYAQTLDLVAEDAYALVEAGPAASAQFTFAHEVAHLFGCRHDISDDSFEGIMHAYSFNIGRWPNVKSRSTVLWVSRINNNPPPPRTLHFSNPDVKYRGTYTGTEEQENNAQQFRNTACTVADFVSGEENPVSIGIEGYKWICPCDLAILNGVIYGGVPGIYAYEWTISTDGGLTYGSVQGTGTGFQIEAPCTLGDYIRVRLQVTDPNSNVYYSFAVVRAVNDPEDGQPCIHLRKETEDLVNAFKISPNPATNQIAIEVYIEEVNQILIEITSVSGQVIFQHNLSNIVKGWNKVIIDVSAFQPGGYFCRMTENKSVKQSLITILR